VFTIALIALATVGVIFVATVYEMEAGRRPQPRGSTLRKLADALGVDLTELTEDYYSPKYLISLLSAAQALKMTPKSFSTEKKLRRPIGCIRSSQD